MLPIPGSALSAKFSGPYDIAECLSDIDYVIGTPEHKRKTRVCHINMLKPYHSRECQDGQKCINRTQSSESPRGCALVVSEPANELNVSVPPPQSTRLSNSEMLNKLPELLSHPSSEQKSDIIALVNHFPCLFQDTPSRTTVTQHDIDVNNARLIKQHAYCVNPAKREVMKREAEYLLEHGLAIHSSSSWSYPCVVETKSDG